MWADNETDKDFLGFQVHADLIRELVTDPSMLPTTVGVFGDWGGGKTSIMRLLQKEFDRDVPQEDSEPDEALDGVACLYFNGWLFEGYDDAKAALLSSVLQQLADHKRFGPKVRDHALALLKSVDWMRVARWTFKEVAVPLIGAHATGGLNLFGHLFNLGKGSVQTKVLGQDDGGDKKDEDEKDGKSAKGDKAETTDVADDVRGFRERFAKLLEDSDIKTLVVLIDDLDRCSPQRIIDNLEAIKLFLSVEGTAFIIGADPRIVRHAVALTYGTVQLPSELEGVATTTDIVTDYLEKVIQVPYHLPKLSPAEVETYMALLFCQLHAKDDLNGILAAVRDHRERDRYSVFGYGAIKAHFGARELSQELEQSLHFSHTSARAITEGLKGNPRQVKRFLNAFLLRKKLARVAKLADVRDDVLVKLMVLEYAHLSKFRELYTWQAVQEGQPEQLEKLEEAANDDKGTDASLPSGWLTPSLRRWLRAEPTLAKTDLRDYFWVARNRLESTLSDASLIPPAIRVLATVLLGDGVAPREREAALAEAVLLPSDLQEVLLAQVAKQAPVPASGLRAFSALVDLTRAGAADAAGVLVETLMQVPAADLDPSLGLLLLTLREDKPEVRTSLDPVLDQLRRGRTRIAAALES